MIQDKPKFEFKPVVNNNMFTDKALEYQARRDLIENPSITKKYQINKGILSAMSHQEQSRIALQVQLQTEFNVLKCSHSQIAWLATINGIM